jgi:hypothetical protein
MKLGHACSAPAKSVIKIDREQYWMENDQFLMVALMESLEDITLRELETWRGVYVT